MECDNCGEETIVYESTAVSERWGRVMSRTQAYDDLSVGDFKEQMSDVVSSSVNEETLDEAPGAYKSADLIEAAITPTAEVVDQIRPVLNLKAE